MIVYKATNTKTGNSYYGITKNFPKRKSSHKQNAREENKSKKGCKTPFYDSIRSYGWETFKWEILFEGTEEECSVLEIELIANDNSCYNLHEGGSIGFNVITKSEEEVNKWKTKLSNARKGRTPAKGMIHTEDNKKLFSKVSKEYWDTQETYDWEEIKHLSHKEAKEKFGISTTHYYRLKKRALPNE